MTEEEKNKMEKDILFQIDMQLYDEFNDTIATMNDHLGDIYSLRDVEEVEKAEKEKEIKLLRETVRNLQKENEELKNMSGIDVYKLGQKTQRDKTNFEIERLQKELDKKDKVIENLYSDIEYEYQGTNYLKSLEEYYEEVEEENEGNK